MRENRYLRNVILLKSHKRILGFKIGIIMIHSRIAKLLLVVWLQRRLSEDVLREESRDKEP